VGSGSSSGNRFQFTGRENDGHGLYYNRARYYSPSLGRFLGEDPIGIAGGLNLYTYGLNNPLLRTDPLGLVSCASTGSDRCREELGDCTKQALKSDIQCTLTVAALTVACLEAAAAACLFAGPAGFGPCFAALSATCVSLGETGALVCQAILAAEIVVCLQDFVRCAKKGRRSGS
jgi:RHS repeat-associated protein